ncbi:MAG: hypothetical protein JW876_02300 [Candidatus Krumholzibacteriota bacterium]|nr:hypothetical protein [Candidatus Krumholzibacteriota bacterium]
MKRMCAFVALVAFCAVAPLAAGPPRLVNYQGVLADMGGVVVDDGVYEMTFRLWDEEFGGSVLWAETRMVPVGKGIFNVLLGDVTPLELPFDAIYFLGVSIGAEAELEPRVPLTSAPYSLGAGGVFGTENMFPGAGPVGIGVHEPLERLDVDGAIRLGGTDGMAPGTIRWTGVDFEGSDGSAWLSLTASGGAGLPAGAAGRTLRHDDAWWVADSTIYNDGTRVGIGTTAPQFPLHVNGIAQFDLPGGKVGISTPGGWPGIIAYEGTSSNRRDVIFDQNGIILSASTDGNPPSATGGIVINENGNLGVGVYEPAFPLHIRDDGETYACVESPSGYGCGIAFRVGGELRWRLQYHPVEGTLQFYREGVGEKLVIGDGGRVGINTEILHGDAMLEVHDNNPGPASMTIVGYSMTAVSPSNGGGIGVAGIRSDDGVGGIGVYGSATTGAMEMNNSVGVYGQSDDGYGVYSDGTLGSAGPLVAVAPTQDYGHREVYAVASAENWFEDVGEDRLAGGEATVRIDPVFAQTVDTGAGYHVFLTPLGDRALYVAEKSGDRFVVRGLGEGNEDIAFDWRIVAKRRGHEAKRLAPAPDPARLRPRIERRRPVVDGG